MAMTFLQSGDVVIHKENGKLRYLQIVWLPSPDFYQMVQYGLIVTAEVCDPSMVTLRGGISWSSGRVALVNLIPRIPTWKGKLSMCSSCCVDKSWLSAELTSHKGPLRTNGSICKSASF